MIIKEYGKYIVYCDGCDETLIDGVSWREAVEAVKQNDWKFEKVDGSGSIIALLVSGGSSVWMMSG